MADKGKRGKKKSTVANESERKKVDSGMPGGGAGRREEVGHSGVYPASGPLPPENAPYRDEASWGQGERGEQGYKDSGDSEISGLPGNAKMRNQRENSMGGSNSQSEIPRQTWKDFLDGFSRAHQGWIASVIVTEDGIRQEPEVQELPLMAVNADLKHGEDDTIEIILGTDTSHAITHSLAGAKRIQVNRDERGVETGLEIEASSGKARLQFRSPASPETIDGVP